MGRCLLKRVFHCLSEDGIYSFTVDIYLLVYPSHSHCELGHRDSSEVFRNILDFLGNNPSEVILLEFQMHSFSNSALYVLYDVMENTTGFVDMIYVHERGVTWPLMGDLVQTNKVCQAIGAME